MKYEYAPGATPLDPDERQALIPSDIATQQQLNEAEQAGIVRAELWLFAKRRSDVLTEPFLKRLHAKMFRSVWKWAGKYRASEKNLGVPPYSILSEIQKLLSDVRYWIDNGTYDWTELGARYHHRLVVIHPFPNGNGRHARLATDALLVHHGQDRFTWGLTQSRTDLIPDSETRQKYLHALRQADRRIYGDLIEFVRS